MGVARRLLGAGCLMALLSCTTASERLFLDRILAQPESADYSTLQALADSSQEVSMPPDFFGSDYALTVGYNSNVDARQPVRWWRVDSELYLVQGVYHVTSNCPTTGVHLLLLRRRQTAPGHAYYDILADGFREE